MTLTLCSVLLAAIESINVVILHLGDLPNLIQYGTPVNNMLPV